MGIGGACGGGRARGQPLATWGVVRVSGRETHRGLSAFGTCRWAGQPDGLVERLRRGAGARSARSAPPGQGGGQRASGPSLKGAQVWIERAAALAKDAPAALRLDPPLAEAVAAAWRALDERMDALHAAIGEHCRFEGQETVWRCLHGVLPDRWREIGGGLAQAA